MYRISAQSIPSPEIEPRVLTTSEKILCVPSSSLKQKQYKSLLFFYILLVENYRICGFYKVPITLAKSSSVVMDRQFRV